MGFIKSSKLKTVWILAFVVGIALAGRAFAQETDTTAAQTVDTAAATADTTGEVTAVSPDTVTASVPAAKSDKPAAAAVTEEAGPHIDSQVYKYFSYV